MATEEIFGPYRIIEKIGHGGMGVVYLAEEPEQKIQVALKVLPEHLNRSAAFRKRFDRECELLRRLEHAGIPRLLDEGEIEGKRYLTMQYVAGHSLERLMEEHPDWYNSETVSGVLYGTLRILSYAHSQGVVHRDLSPRNIIVSPDGELNIIDFGIARLTNDATLTMTGQHMGTPAFMAPELFGETSAREFDGRADLWALGVIGFRLLTRRAPFDFDNHVTLIRMIVDPGIPAPSVLDFAPDVPANLARVVDRALRKDPEHRYSSADEMRKDLERPNEIPFEAYNLKIAYQLGQLVYLPSLNRWGAVVEVGNFGKQTYFGITHSAGEMTRRVGELRSEPTPATGRAICRECGGQVSTERFCIQCGRIKDEALPDCKPTDSVAVAEKRRKRKSMLLKAVGGLAATVLIAVMSFFGWRIYESAAEHADEGAAAASSSGRLSAESSNESFQKNPDLVVDANTVTFDELVRLPQFGEANALLMLAYRHNHGPYRSFDHVKRVLRMGSPYFANTALARVGVVSTDAAPSDNEFLSRYRRTNFNTATQAELEKVPHIGKKIAEGFIECRKSIHVFQGLDDILSCLSPYNKNSRRFGFLEFVSLGDHELDERFRRDVKILFEEVVTDRTANSTDVKTEITTKPTDAAATVYSSYTLDINTATLAELDDSLNNPWLTWFLMMHRYRKGPFLSLDEVVEEVRKGHFGLYKSWGTLEAKIRAQLIVGVNPDAIDPVFLESWSQPLDLNVATDDQLLSVPFLRRKVAKQILLARKDRPIKSINEIRTMMDPGEREDRVFVSLQDFLTVGTTE